ncbi:MAG: response regulator [Planctomycetota bacterium]
MTEVRPSLGGLRVMLVEDEVAARVALGHMLARLGASVQQVGDAEHAAKLARHLPAHRRPEVVLADYNLPGTDGLQLLGWFDEHLPATRLALITAQDRYAFRGSLSPRITFFRKPASFDRIVRYLAGVTGESCETERPASSWTAEPVLVR